ncbi:MAG: UpxY family transcription antiterminator, partial [Candidatus Marinimicrobia bacterium]|nr:UpxY family transcription antiterminator [Candidatus Neomarinimicrobiota bacterium]
MNIELKWYVLRVRPRHEKAVAERLSEKYEIYLPLIKDRRKWSDRMKTVEIPLFSGYLFIKTTVKMKYYILEDRSVGSFVQFGNRPAIIQEKEIFVIRQMLMQPKTLKVENGFLFSKGERIQITRGVFAGIEGQVVNMKNKHRLFVAIEQLGKIISIEIDTESLE